MLEVKQLEWVVGPHPEYLRWKTKQARLRSLLVLGFCVALLTSGVMIGLAFKILA